MPINFPNSPEVNDTYSSAGTTWIYDGSVWNVVTSSTTINIPETNSFSNISIAGQDSVVAESATDTLTLIAGSNVTLTTDAESDSITINLTDSGDGGSVLASNSFETITIAGQDSVVAESATDTLTLVAGSGIALTTDSETDTITVTSTVTSGITLFSNLTDVNSASLTVDKVYLPAITMLTVTNVGASAYRFDQYGTTDNPTIYAINGTTIAFDLTVTGHPFLIQTGAGINYNTGLFHVAANGTVSTGASAQGKDSGVLYWKIPSDISGGYRYQCDIHASMVGSISIKNFGSI